MRHINPPRAGLAVGLVIGLWHFMWVSLVAIGWAKPLMDFVLHLHFIQLRYEMAPFVVGTAVLLVAVTFAVGAAFGIVFALVWNWLSTSSDTAVPISRQGSTSVT